MAKICYRQVNFQTKTLHLIDKCNTIIAEYIRDGYQLTLRQLYYQLVSRDIIPNSVKEYNKLGDAVSNARLAGLIDWDAIEDRGRNLRSVGHWEKPTNIIASCAWSFRTDKWITQDVRPEIWIEKEALAGVFDRICSSLDVPYIACKGYMSQSEMWAAAMRYVKYIKNGQSVQIFHFGDHDPSGIDMTRDIRDRLREFICHHSGLRAAEVLFDIERVALNMDQVEQYDPPENPAKQTDTRFQAYQELYGDSSWELDALEPRVLAALVTTKIKSIRDDERWNDQVEAESASRAILHVASEHWDTTSKYLEKKYPKEIDQRIGHENNLSKLEIEESDDVEDQDSI